MPLRSCLFAILLVLAPLAAMAQSIYQPGPSRPSPLTTSPPIDSRPATPPAPGTPGAPGAPAPQPPTAPGQKPAATNPAGQATHRPPARQPIPPGSVIAPPGSIVLPPPPGRPKESRAHERRRITGVTQCNQQQISCNQTCNARTMGAARNLCYKQCYSKFLHCANIANDVR